MNLDGRHGASPDSENQQRVIQQALAQAKLEARDINYINAHGTGTPLGDSTELNSLEQCGLSGCLINSTKAITGHCLTGAGTVELVATVLQMRAGRCHANRNLESPIDEGWRWNESREVQIEQALSTSFAFGGLNAALVLSHGNVDEFAEDARVRGEP